VETNKSCEEEILSNPSTPSLVNENTASCYDFICQNGGICTYQPRKECESDKVCTESVINDCQSNVPVGECKEYSGCSSQLNDDGLWEAKCEYKNTERWNELVKEENHCFEVICKDNEWILQERDNVSEWRSQTTGCFEYFCDNESGGLFLNLCNNSDGIDRKCVNDTCDDVNNDDKKVWKVKIEFDDLHSSDLNVTELLEMISVACGVEVEDIGISVEVSETGIISIFVYVDDEEVAQSIVSTMNEIDKKEDCGYGVLCRSKSVVIVTKTLELSQSHQTVNYVILTLIMIFVAAMN